MGCLFAFVMLFSIFFVIYLFKVNIFLGLIGTGVLLGIFFKSVNDSIKLEEQEKREIQKRKNKLKELTKRLSEIYRSQLISTDFYTKRIIFDSKNNLIGFIDANRNLAKQYRFEQILEVSVLENGNTITTTSRRSQIGGALVGGLVAGGVGALIGGLSGEKKSVEKLESIQIKVIVDDNVRPVYTFQFNDGEVERNSDEYNKIINIVNHWHALLLKTMKQNEVKDTERKINKSRSDETASISKELKELFELKEQGILTEEEFIKQKEKILNR